MTTRGRGRSALLALAAVLLAAGGCSAHQDGSAPTATTAASATSSAEPAPTTTSPATAMRQWEQRAGDHFTQSSQALQQVSDASSAEDAAALGSGCQKLHDTNTIGLQRDLPTPDPRLTERLQRMIDDINTATHACVRFVLARQEIDAATYRDYLARAVDHLHEAKAILEADLAPR
jgi:hypothetical protein